LRGVDQEDHAAPAAVFGVGGQLFQMAPAPGADGVREHRQGTAVEGTGFNFEQDLFAPVPEEKIETALPRRDFPFDDLRLFQAGNQSFPEQKLHRVVGLGSMQQHRGAVPRHRHCGIGRRPSGEGGIFHQGHGPARDQQFPEASRIGEMGLDDLPLTSAGDDKAVETPEKPAGNHGGEKRFVKEVFTDVCGPSLHLHALKRESGRMKNFPPPVTPL